MYENGKIGLHLETKEAVPVEIVVNLYWDQNSETLSIYLLENTMFPNTDYGRILDLANCDIHEIGYGFMGKLTVYPLLKGEDQGYIQLTYAAELPASESLMRMVAYRSLLREVVSRTAGDFGVILHHLAEKLKTGVN